MYSENDIFSRSELLVGGDAMRRIGEARVILFGVGGVGSWCAESLVRSGVRRLTIVDSDEVSVSNINRQLPATTETVGQAKVETLRQRLVAINPHADITTLQTAYTAETADSFRLDEYDYVVDAIDSLEHKADLIAKATRTRATLFSSMGAALKLDASRIRTAEFWKVQGCPLAAALRRRLKQRELPAKKFTCVFSDEALENKGTPPEITESASRWDKRKARVNGTMAHVTAIFGFTLAGLVVQDIIAKGHSFESLNNHFINTAIADFDDIRAARKHGCRSSACDVWDGFH